MKTFELEGPSQDVWGIDEWVLREQRVRRRALRAGSEGAAWGVLNREASTRTSRPSRATT